MDPAQGETQGKSITSKIKAKVKGVKSKVRLPGQKKRQNDDGLANEGDSSDYNSDDSPKKPGPETGYNVGASTPFTTVKTTPPPSAHDTSSPQESHNRDYDSRSSHTTSGYDAPSGYDAASRYDAPRSTVPTLDEKFRYREGGNMAPTTESMAKIDEDYKPNLTTASNTTASRPREGVLGHVKDTVGGAAAAVGSRVGYYTEVEKTPVVPVPADPNAPSVIDKAKASLGMDKPRDPNAPTLVEKTKATLGLDKPRDPNAPTMMEKAKATLGLDKPSDPNAPTMMEKTKATLGLGPSAPHSGNSASQPGVIDRVSGAMSSLFTSSPKEGTTGEAMQDSFPAHSDYVPSAATVPHQSYGDRYGEERMVHSGATTTPTGVYNQSTTPTAAYNQTTMPTGTYNQATMPTGTYNQTSTPTGAYNQTTNRY